MENRIYNEVNGLWYEQQGDCFLPCLALPEEEQQPIGVWGQRHLRFIKENHKVLYTNLLTSGKFNVYLAGVNEQAEEMYLRLVEQMKANESITEKLKAENQIEWVRKMNNIAERAREVVNKKIIFNILP